MVSDVREVVVGADCLEFCLSAAEVPTKYTLLSPALMCVWVSKWVSLSVCVSVCVCEWVSGWVWVCVFVLWMSCSPSVPPAVLADLAEGSAVYCGASARLWTEQTLCTSAQRNRHLFKASKWFPPFFSVPTIIAKLEQFYIFIYFCPIIYLYKTKTYVYMQRFLF